MFTNFLQYFYGFSDFGKVLSIFKNDLLEYRLYLVFNQKLTLTKESEYPIKHLACAWTQKKIYVENQCFLRLLKV